jgi:hypothetical protein
VSIPTAPEALDLYETVGRGFTAFDADNGWAASTICTALAAPRETAGLVSRNPTMWSDPVAAPDALIRPMAQRLGIRGATGLSIATLRGLIADPGAEVGSTAAIVASVKLVLSGTKTVRVRSGYNAVAGNDEWGYTTVIVDPAESPGEAAVKAAAEAGAPDWVVIHYRESTGVTWDEVVGDWDSQSGSWDEA